MGSNSSFYNQNSTVYTQTNPAGPAQAPVVPVVTKSPSSFYNSTGPILTSLAEANFSLSISIPGLALGSNEWLFGYKFDFAGSFAANFAGSQAGAGVASTSAAILVIKQNGVQVGTITYNGAAGTFVSPQLAFAVGDLLEIYAPVSVDPTLAHLSITLLGTRN